jgi:GNAT superfamily N-acetyltransferase
MTQLRVEAVTNALPADFDVLRAEAAAEGYRNLDRLAADWAARMTCFDREGETLLAAYSDDALAGIGGLTIDPLDPGALRLRRFYVARAARRSGIGRALVQVLLKRALESGRPVTVNAAAGSAPFWESLGFIPDSSSGHSHRLGASIVGS